MLPATSEDDHGMGSQPRRLFKRSKTGLKDAILSINLAASELWVQILCKSQYCHLEFSLLAPLRIPNSDSMSPTAHEEGTLHSAIAGELSYMSRP